MRMARYIKAVGDRLVVSPLEPERISEGGIILGEIKERPMAVILSIGEAVDSSELKPGQVVFWKRDRAVEFTFDGLHVASITLEQVIGFVDSDLGVEVVFSLRKEAHP